VRVKNTTQYGSSQEIKKKSTSSSMGTIKVTMEVLMMSTSKLNQKKYK
jgi:hypothetical protein